MELDNSTGQYLGSVPTTCTYHENFKQLLLPPVYSVVLVAGLPLNACVIIQICMSRRALTRTAVYTLNLALADLLYACSLPLLIYNYAQGDYWPFGDFACRLVRFLFYANLHGSILFLTCISFQRYLGICHPLAIWHKRGGRRAAWLVCGAVWLAVTAQCLPTAVFAMTGIQRNRTVCYDLSPPSLATRYMPYGMALTIIGFLLPFTALLACYYSLAHHLCRQDGPEGPVAQERRGKAARMAMVVAAIFAISFLPFHITKTAYLAVRSTPGVPCSMLETFAAAYKGTRPFASVNSILDPILFYFTQKKFRRRPQELLQKLTAKWQGRITEPMEAGHIGPGQPSSPRLCPMQQKTHQPQTIMSTIVSKAAEASPPPNHTETASVVSSAGHKVRSPTDPKISPVTIYSASSLK